MLPSAPLSPEANMAVPALCGNGTAPRPTGRPGRAAPGLPGEMERDRRSHGPFELMIVNLALRAGGGRAVAGELAQLGGQRGGREEDGRSRDAGRTPEIGGDLVPGQADQRGRDDVRAGRGGLAAEIEERSLPRAVELREDGLLGGRESLQAAVARLVTRVGVGADQDVGVSFDR